MHVDTFESIYVCIGHQWVLLFMAAYACFTIQANTCTFTACFVTTAALSPSTFIHTCILSALLCTEPYNIVEAVVYSNDAFSKHLSFDLLLSRSHWEKFSSDSHPVNLHSTESANYWHSSRDVHNWLNDELHATEHSLHAYVYPSMCPVPFNMVSD